MNRRRFLGLALVAPVALKLAPAPSKLLAPVGSVPPPLVCFADNAVDIGAYSRNRWLVVYVGQARHYVPVFE